MCTSLWVMLWGETAAMGIMMQEEERFGTPLIHKGSISITPTLTDRPNPNTHRKALALSPHQSRVGASSPPRPPRRRSVRLGSSGSSFSPARPMVRCAASGPRRAGRGPDHHVWLTCCAPTPRTTALTIPALRSFHRVPCKRPRRRMAS